MKGVAVALYLQKSVMLTLKIYNNFVPSQTSFFFDADIIIEMHNTADAIKKTRENQY